MARTISLNLIFDKWPQQTKPVEQNLQSKLQKNIHAVAAKVFDLVHACSSQSGHYNQNVIPKSRLALAFWKVVRLLFKYDHIANKQIQTADWMYMIAQEGLNKEQIESTRDSVQHSSNEARYLIQQSIETIHKIAEATAWLHFYPLLTQAQNKHIQGSTPIQTFERQEWPQGLETICRRRQIEMQATINSLQKEIIESMANAYHLRNTQIQYQDYTVEQLIRVQSMQTFEDQVIDVDGASAEMQYALTTATQNIKKVAEVAAWLIVFPEIRKEPNTFSLENAIDSKATENAIQASPRKIKFNQCIFQKTAEQQLEHMTQEIDDMQTLVNNTKRELENREATSV